MFLFKELPLAIPVQSAASGENRAPVLTRLFAHALTLSSWFPAPPSIPPPASPTLQSLKGGVRFLITSLH